MKKNKFFLPVCLLMPLVLMAACDTENGDLDSANGTPDSVILSDTAVFPSEMNLSEPLLSNPDLAGLVSMEVRQATYEGSGIWILDV